MSQEPNNIPEAKTQLFTSVGNMGPRLRLRRVMEDTPEVYEKIMMFIERGAYDYVAAECFGITKATWDRWLARGRNAKNGPYRKLFLDVTQAFARARIVAEMTVSKDDPKFYLTRGPGKTKPNRPGWSTDSIEVDDQVASRSSQQESIARYEQVSNADLAKTLQVMVELGFAEIAEPLDTAPTTDPGVDSDTLDGQIL